MVDVAAKVTVIVACAECRRQYDASELPLGALFRCHCGQLVKVATATARDAAVVRCSACGAPRQGEATACGHCSAAFTAHERDMHTTCPECMARISDRARFCHHCGTRIGTRAPAGRRTERRCPACAKPSRLSHRELGRPAVAVLECPCCAGVWLTPEAIEDVLERSRSATPRAPHEPARFRRPDLPRQTGPLYRRCPICEGMMSRVNYGRRSGVIVDRCNEHGLWFDERELSTVVAWVRSGGEERAHHSLEEERRATAMRERFKPRFAGVPPDAREPDGTPGWLELLVGTLG